MPRISSLSSSICRSTSFRARTSFKTNALHSLMSTPDMDRSAWDCSPAESRLCPAGGREDTPGVYAPYEPWAVLRVCVVC